MTASRSRSSRASSPAPASSPKNAILIAAGAYFIFTAFVPFGSTLLYPLTLFTTWVHEMGHGMSALICGGSFSHLEIRWNAGGTAWSYAAHGWPDAIVAAGGLLAPPLLGAVILATVHGPRRARGFLLFLVGALALSVALYVRSAVGIVTMTGLALVFGYVALFAFRENPERRVWFAQLLAVILSIDTLTRMVSYAFMGKTSEGKVSDTAHIAENLGGHHLLWGLVITVLALGMLAFGVWWAWRPRRA